MIGVVAGSGGAGASTLAAGLAQSGAASGLTTLLVDLDPVGGGPELLLGAEREPGRRWSDLWGVRGRIGADVLAGSLPCAHGVRLLTWGRGPTSALPAGAVEAVLDAARRSFDLVIVDLPRRPDAACLASLPRLRRVLVVVTNELRSAAAAERTLASLGPLPSAAIVRRRPGGMSDLDTAGLVGIPLAAGLRSDPELAAAAERGDAPLARRGPLRDLCQRLCTGILDDRAA